MEYIYVLPDWHFPFSKYYVLRFTSVFYRVDCMKVENLAKFTRIKLSSSPFLITADGATPDKVT